MRRPLGQRHFCAARPNEAVVRAAMFHDSGWYDYEASPSIAPDTGKPLNFMQVPWGKPQRQAFEWAIAWMTRIDPYSGLLLSNTAPACSAGATARLRTRNFQYAKPAGRQRKLFGPQ